MSHDDLIQSRLRELVGDPEFTNANRNWVQCIVQGKVDEAVTEINQFLLTPPAFMWLGLAHAIASGKSAKQISNLVVVFSLQNRESPHSGFLLYLLYLAIQSNDGEVFQYVRGFLDYGWHRAADNQLLSDPMYTQHPLWDIILPNRNNQLDDYLIMLEICRARKWNVMASMSTHDRWTEACINYYQWKEELYPPNFSLLFTYISGEESDFRIEYLWDALLQKKTEILLAVFRGDCTLTKEFAKAFTVSQAHVRRVCEEMIQDHMFYDGFHRLAILYEKEEQKSGAPSVESFLTCFMETIADTLLALEDTSLMEKIVREAAFADSVQFLLFLFQHVAKSKQLSEAQITSIVSRREGPGEYLFHLFPTSSEQLERVSDLFYRRALKTWNNREWIKEFCWSHRMVSEHCIGFILDMYPTLAYKLLAQSVDLLEYASRHWSITGVERVLATPEAKEYMLAQIEQHPAFFVPIRCAVMRGYYPLVKLFQSYGADLSYMMKPLQQMSGHQLKDCDVHLHSTKCVELFSKQQMDNASLAEMMHCACEAPNLPMFRWLLQQEGGLDALRKESDGESCLVMCFTPSTGRAYKDSVYQIAELILQHDPEQLRSPVPSSCTTALHLGMKQYHIGLVRYLVSCMNEKDMATREGEKYISCFVKQWDSVYCESDYPLVMEVFRMLADMMPWTAASLERFFGLVIHRLCLLDALALEYLIEQMPDLCPRRYLKSEIPYLEVPRRNIIRLSVALIKHEVLTEAAFREMGVDKETLEDIFDLCRCQRRKGATSALVKRSASEAFPEIA